VRAWAFLLVLARNGGTLRWGDAGSGEGPRQDAEALREAVRRLVVPEPGGDPGLPGSGGGGGGAGGQLGGAAGGGLGAGAPCRRWRRWHPRIRRLGCGSSSPVPSLPKRPRRIPRSTGSSPTRSAAAPRRCSSSATARYSRTFSAGTTRLSA